MIGRVKGEAGAVDTPIGALPRPEDLDLTGVALSDEAREKLFGLEREGWRGEFEGIGEYLSGYGERMPEALHAERTRLARDLGARTLSRLGTAMAPTNRPAATRRAAAWPRPPTGKPPSRE